jgi:hypothetical protein
MTTQELLYELYNRVDDNLYSPEKRYDPFLDSIDLIEKRNLCQVLRLTYEEYAKDNEEE